ncbi:MAG: CDP-diacylglycerol--serine O-phosphatidyltransferase [Ignavibacteriales bacterium]|nr:CDP-diacylglycerol--serine O-phosphatidyltransferase [Ignavibacteriales bacterium]
MKITRAVVPSLFTVLNIFCGFLAILYTNQGRIEMAVWFIILAAIFDSFDGVMARITRSSSQFGVELDSLADVVSFGAAPSFLVYQAHLHTMENWGIIISSMPLVFGAIRLARFNVQLVGFDKDHFKGLPIPFQAITICAFMLENYTQGYGLSGWQSQALAPLVAGLSLLMVSRVQYDTFPKFTKRELKAHPWKALGFTVAALIVVASLGRFLFPVLMLMILFGIVRSLFVILKHWAFHVDKEAEEESEVSSIDI